MGAALCSHAQTAAPSGTLKEVVVTATRFEQPMADVLADITLISKEDIAAQGATTMEQLLAGLPGVQVQYGKVYLRGAEARMTAVYVDGVRVDSQDGLSLGGGVKWDLIPVEQIEYVEVLRGAASAVYGSDGMGGVVQIFTRQGTQGVHPSVALGVGSHGTRKASLALDGASDGWDYALAVTQLRSDGFDTRPDVVHTPSAEAYDSQDSSLRLGYALSPQHKLEAGVLQRLANSSAVPWNGGANTHIRSALHTSSLAWKARWTDSYRSSLRVSRSVLASKDDQPNDYATTLQTVALENQWTGLGGKITAIAEQKTDAFDAQPTTWDPVIIGRRTQLGLGLGYGANLGAHGVQLSVRSDKDSNFGTFGTGAVSYAYKITPAWRAMASTGSAFRAPTLEQTFGPYGDTRLLPEQSKSSEVGLAYADPATSAKAVLYRTSFQDLISSSQTLTTCSAGGFCYYNVGQALVEGVSLSASRQWGFATFHVSGDWLNPVNEDDGKQLSLRARRNRSVGVDTRWNDWTLGAKVVEVGERFNEAANTTLLPEYALLNLYASVRLSPQWTWNTRIDNATDKKYTQQDSYAAPGVTLFTELRWAPKF